MARQNVPLIRFADRVCPISDTGLDLLELPDRTPPRSLVDALRTFDSIVSWYGANRDEFRAAAQRLGLPVTLHPALPEGGLHAVDFYLHQVGAPPGARPRLNFPRTDGGFAVLHPFSGSPKKNWPLANYRRLAAWLEPRLPVRWCAGPDEPLPDAHRFDDLYELAGWLAQARVFIGNDSGIAHLAAAVGTPVLVLFGPTDPQVWAPRAETLRIVHRPGPMEAIGEDEVMSALADLLTCAL